jgi:hypothetical protein
VQSFQSVYTSHCERRTRGNIKLYKIKLYYMEKYGQLRDIKNIVNYTRLSLPV